MARITIDIDTRDKRSIIDAFLAILPLYRNRTHTNVVISLVEKKEPAPAAS